MEDIPISWQLAALAVLLVVSGFFSIAETSMMAINRYRLKAMVRLGSRGAQIATQLLAKTDKLLGVILLGNNLVNAAAATLVGLITIELFGDDKIALGLGTLAVTFLILVFSEITPKVIGAAYAERIAIPASYILAPLLRVLYPIVWFVNLFVSVLLFITRMRPPSDGHAHRLTMEELRSLVIDSGQFMPKKHQSILVNMFDLEAITVEDVMTPKTQIEAVDLEAPMDAIIGQLATSYHTRLLVYRGELGNVAGILHLRRVLRPMHVGELDKTAIEEMLAEAYYVPANTAALTQLQLFQENRQRFALVVDEYGELQGLVTLEDIIEEIIGEFTTTAPMRATRIHWEDDKDTGITSALVEGSATLRDLNRKLGLSLPLDGPKTLNGLILEQLQDIPESGVSVKIGQVPMEIVQTQDRVIKTVRIFSPHEAEEDEAEA
jgi:Mg2+/Co2+ transporter CorB